TGIPQLFRISAFGADRLVINDQGSVGIGTATPQNKLDVAGGMAVGAGYAGVQAAPSNGMIIQGPVGIGNPGTVGRTLYVSGTAKITNDVEVNRLFVGAPVSPGFPGDIVANGRIFVATSVVFGPSGSYGAIYGNTGGINVNSHLNVAGTIYSDTNLITNGNLAVGGNANISGTLTKGSGGFIIDHPLDPKNKVLRHSFVESPDMKNIYDGIAVLAENGEISVELPNYFTALNKDYRYQLTPIGAYAGVYIKREIQENKFVIAGGYKGLKVSWQVTGIRKDAFAQKNPIVVEEIKGANNNFKKGEYLYPKVF
ncbi:MAG: hypothetical protein KJ842_04195, partial [Candidatus Omnitrophica bacterium]|nr:hypothetical protein [Candidatus Omnitrophota bacterium]